LLRLLPHVLRQNLVASLCLNLFILLFSLKRFELLPYQLIHV
jgi:hypothetical protein